MTSRAWALRVRPRRPPATSPPPAALSRRTSFLTCLTPTSGLPPTRAAVQGTTLQSSRVFRRARRARCTQSPAGRRLRTWARPDTWPPGDAAGAGASRLDGRASRTRLWAGRFPCAEGAHERLGGPDREPLADGPLRRLLDGLGVVEAEQRPGVAHVELAVADRVAHLLGELEEPERVRDRRALLADPLRDLLLREAVLARRAPRRPRPPRSRSGRRAGGSRRARARRPRGRSPRGRRRDLLQPGALRRAPAPLAGDDAVLRAPRLRTRIGSTTPCSRIDAASSSSFGLVEALARLLRVPLDRLDRQARSERPAPATGPRGRDARRGGVREERGHAAAEGGAPLVGQAHATPPGLAGRGWSPRAPARGSSGSPSRPRRRAGWACRGWAPRRAARCAG